MRQCGGPQLPRPGTLMGWRVSGAQSRNPERKGGEWDMSGMSQRQRMQEGNWAVEVQSLRGEGR